jgi:hypothetical protein
MASSSAFKASSSPFESVAFGVWVFVIARFVLSICCRAIALEGSIWMRCFELQQGLSQVAGIA